MGLKRLSLLGDHHPLACPFLEHARSTATTGAAHLRGLISGRRTRLPVGDRSVGVTKS
jgi:hypothetical protein